MSLVTLMASDSEAGKFVDKKMVSRRSTCLESIRIMLYFVHPSQHLPRGYGLKSEWVNEYLFEIN